MDVIVTVMADGELTSDVFSIVLVSYHPLANQLRLDEAVVRV